MALNSRPILPKSVKITNKPLSQWYKSQHKQCEICVLDGVISSPVQLHHIIPGTGRTDEIWNIICLCEGCHRLATEHINGASAQQFNILLFALKYLKGEITQKKLYQIVDQTIIDIAIYVMEPIFWRYKHGIIQTES
jgi:5-methylcytosine-specific restriction endonuclease McrA